MGLGFCSVWILATSGWLHYMPFRVQFPVPTVREEWIQKQRVAFAFPPLHGGITSVQAAEASTWLWQRANQGDIPSITQAAADLMAHMFPADMKFGRSNSVQSRLLTEVLFASAVTRLRRALQQTKPPRWAVRVLQAAPPAVQRGISDPGGEWQTQMVRLLGTAGPGSSVYVLFSHSGWYVGKANLARQWAGIPSPGLQARCIEHARAVMTTKTRDSALARYAELRKSLGSLSFLPNLICHHEVQALAMEALIIKALAPSANRADQIQASARTGNSILLKRTKVARRRRPFPRFRAVDGRAVSIWKVPHFLDLAQRELDQPTAAPEMEDCRHVRASFS